MYGVHERRGLPSGAPRLVGKPSSTSAPGMKEATCPVATKGQHRASKATLSPGLMLPHRSLEKHGKRRTEGDTRPCVSWAPPERARGPPARRAGGKRPGREQQGPGVPRTESPWLLCYPAEPVCLRTGQRLPQGAVMMERGTLTHSARDGGQSLPQLHVPLRSLTAAF